MRTRSIMVLCLVLTGSVRSSSASTEKPTLVTGINVETLIANMMGQEISVTAPSGGRRGVSYSLTQNDKHIGSIQVGVFRTREQAAEMYQEHLLLTSVGPDARVDGIGDEAVAWAKDRVQFMRDNTVLRVGLRSQSAIRLAREIDRALLEGRSGVRRGAKVGQPQILEIKAVGELVPNGDIQVAIEVRVPEGSLGDRFGFVDRMGVETSGDLPVVDRRRAVRIVRTLDYRVPKKIDEPEKITFEACYATPGCLIATKTFTLADLMAKRP